MANEIKVAAFGVLFTVAACGSPGSPPQPKADSFNAGRGWAMTVAAPSDILPVRTLWVGLVNDSDSAKLICMAGHSVRLEGLTGSSAQVRGPAVHGCETDDSFDLIPAHERRFLTIALPELSNAGAGPLVLEVGVVERSVRSGSSSDKDLVVTWQGTSEEMFRAARLLSK